MAKIDTEIHKLEILLQDAWERGSYRVNLLQTYLNQLRREKENGR